MVLSIYSLRTLDVKYVNIVLRHLAELCALLYNVNKTAHVACTIHHFQVKEARLKNGLNSV